MRSYEAARGLFSFLGFLAWCVIIFGVLIALSGGGIAGAMRNFGGPLGGFSVILATMPGVILAFMGFVSLAIVQSGRAAVDSAEYGQQMLQVARDQLEVSRQALRQGTSVSQSFAALQTEAEKPAPATGAAPSSFSQMPRTENPIEAAVADRPSETIEHLGKTIRVVEAGYECGGSVFPTLEQAKEHIDQRQIELPAKATSVKPYSAQLGVNPAAKLGGASRS